MIHSQSITFPTIKQFKSTALLGCLSRAPEKSQGKETKMLRNRLFNVLVAAAVLLVTALTVREAFATTVLTSRSDAVVACNSLPYRDSIHPQFVGEPRTLVLYSEDGPTGVDGGLPALISAYRSCSR
jgi:hypothetical protein